MSGEDAVQGFGEVVALGCGAVSAEVDVAVVDAAPVGPFPGLAIADEDGSLGGDESGGTGDEAVIGVRDGRQTIAVLGAMGFALRGGGGGIGVDEPEAYAARGVLAVEAGDFGSVAIGDGAVGAGEEKDDRVAVGVGEGVGQRVRGGEQQVEQEQHRGLIRFYPTGSDETVWKSGPLSGGRCYIVGLPPDAFKALLASSQAGKVEAWDGFLARFQELIVSTVIRTASKFAGANRAMVDDLVQDIYVKLCANNYQVLRRVRSDHPNGVYALVKAVAYTTTIDHLRTLRNPLRDESKTVSLDTLQQDLALEEAAESQLHRQMLFGRIDALLAGACPAESLERDRTAFWLYYRQGFTAKEIAGMPAMGLTVKGVESLLFRMVAVLRQELVPEAQKGFDPPSRPKGGEA